MEDIIRQLVMGIVNYSLQLIILLVGSFLIILIKKLYLKFSQMMEAKIGKDNYELAINMVKSIVHSLEAEYNISGIGKAKFKMALGTINELLVSKNITLTEQEKKDLINSAVLQMNVLNNKLKAPTTPSIDTPKVEEKVEDKQEQ